MLLVIEGIVQELRPQLNHIVLLFVHCEEGYVVIGDDVCCADGIFAASNTHTIEQHTKAKV